MRKHMGIEEIAKLAQVQFMAEDSELLVQAVQLIKNPEFILRCRVESDTLSDIDFQAEKQDRLDYMMTITNYLKETMQTIRGDPLLGPFLMQLLQFSLAGFKIGKKFEGELDRTFNQIQQRLANPQPPQPTPEQQKAQAEMQKMQAEMQLKMQLAQQDAQAKGQEMQFKAREHAMDAQTKQAELAMKAREQQLKLVGKVQEAQVNARLKEQEMEMSQAQFWQKMRQDAAKAQIDNVNAFIKGPGGGNAA
jgi:organic radical activating enzyme